jgi:hypothetical protein
METSKAPKRKKLPLYRGSSCNPEEFPGGRYRVLYQVFLVTPLADIQCAVAAGRIVAGGSGLGGSGFGGSGFGGSGLGGSGFGGSGFGGSRG